MHIALNGADAIKAPGIVIEEEAPYPQVLENSDDVFRAGITQSARLTKGLRSRLDVTVEKRTVRIENEPTQLAAEPRIHDILDLSIGSQELASRYADKVVTPQSHMGTESKTRWLVGTLQPKEIANRGSGARQDGQDRWQKARSCDSRSS